MRIKGNNLKKQNNDLSKENKKTITQEKIVPEGKTRNKRSVIERMHVSLCFSKKQIEGKSRKDLLSMFSDLVDRKMKAFILDGFTIRSKIERVIEDKTETEVIVELKIQNINEEKMGEFQEKLNMAISKGIPKIWSDYCFILKQHK